MILSTRTATALRLLKRTPGEAYARKDAALIARIYRRVPLDGVREESEERAARNRIARGNARSSLRSWKWQYGQEVSRGA